MHDDLLQDYLKNYLIDLDNARNLLVDGKVILAHRKLSSLSDKIVSLHKKISSEKNLSTVSEKVEKYLENN